MPKPSVVPLWDTTQTNVVATTAGHSTGGFAANEIPGSGETNYWKYWVGQWTKYLNDADIFLSGLNLPTTATKALLNAANNDVDVSGVANLTSICWVHLTGGGASQTLTGLSGGADGRMLVLMNLTGSDLPIKGLNTGSLANNRLTFPNAATQDLIIPPDGVVALRYDVFYTAIYGGTGLWGVVWTSFNAKPVFEAVTVTGDITITGKYKRGGLLHYVPAIFNQASVASGAGPSQTAGVAGALIAVNSVTYWPLWVPPGTTITSLDVRIAAIAGGVVTCEIDSASGVTGAFSTVAGSSNSTSVTGSLTLTPTTPIVPTTVLWVKVTTAAAATCTIVDFVITTTVA